MATAPSLPRPIDPGPYGSTGRSPWRDVDWSEHLRWVEVAGRAVNVCEIGEGPPVLLVHGHSGTWQNWLENIPHLARHHRVLAPDLPGFGRSAMPAERISIEAYARIVAELCERLEIERAAVVGNSMGGFVSAQLCVDFPQLTSGLVLVSAAGLSTRYMGLSTEFFRRKSVRAFARATNGYAGVPEARAETLVRRPRLRRAVLAMVARHPDRLSPPLASELVRGMGRPAAPFATDAIMHYHLRDRVHDISCPTLIVWGENDRLVPVESAHLYERAIPGARKVVFPDTGHVPMLERPEAFNALLDEFLSLTTDSSAVPSG